jgi:hypothetical protein
MGGRQVILKCRLDDAARPHRTRAIVGTRGRQRPFRDGGRPEDVRWAALENDPIFNSRSAVLGALTVRSGVAGIF